MTQKRASPEDKGDLWRLAVRFARRDLRSGLAGFRIFLIALTLGVAAIAGVGSLGDAFLTGLAEHGRALLGGDVSHPALLSAGDRRRTKFSFALWPCVGNLRSRAAWPPSGQSGPAHADRVEGGRCGLSAGGRAALSPAMPLSTRHCLRREWLRCCGRRCAARPASGLKLGGIRFASAMADFAIRAVLVIGAGSRRRRICAWPARDGLA